MAVFDDLIELGFDYDYVSNLSPEIQERLLAQRTNQGQQQSSAPLSASSSASSSAPLSASSSGLPTFDDEWFSLTGPSGAAEKIRRFNAAGTTVDQLLGAGVQQSEIDWMLSHGYSPPRQREPERVSRLAAEESAPSSASQRGIDVASLSIELGIPSTMVENLVGSGYSANDIRAMYPPQPSEPEPPAAPATVYVGGQALPPNWSSFSSRQKIDWYNRNNIKPSDLEAAGVSKADID